MEPQGEVSRHLKVFEQNVFKKLANTLAESGGD